MASSSTLLSREDLLPSLERHNASFTTLLSLIPSKFYIAPTAEEMDNRFMKNKKRKTGEEIKEHKKRAKQSKLDPANHTTAADHLNASPPPAESSTLPPPVPAAVRPLPPAASISDLRARLQSKLQGFRKDRGIDDSELDPQSRDALEAEQRRRRGEVRDKRRQARKEERRKQKAEPTAKPAKQQLIVPQHRETGDSVSYTQLSLPSSSRSKAPLKSISNPSQALAHLEKHNAKLASMDPERRKQVEENERWAKAEERAKGVKVVDQEGTLKKAVKRLEKKKSKSGKEWADRKKEIEKSHAIAAKKRNDNIAMRNEQRKNKKMGIKTKDKAGTKGKGGKGKGRPGFEGGKKGKKPQTGGAGGAPSGGKK